MRQPEWDAEGKALVHGGHATPHDVLFLQDPFIPDNMPVYPGPPGGNKRSVQLSGSVLANSLDGAVFSSHCDPEECL